MSNSPFQAFPNLVLPETSVDPLQQDEKVRQRRYHFGFNHWEVGGAGKCWEVLVDGVKDGVVVVVVGGGIGCDVRQRRHHLGPLRGDGGGGLVCGFGGSVWWGFY